MNELKLKKSGFLVVDAEIDTVLASIDQMKREGFDAVEPFSMRDFWADDIALDNAKRIKEHLQKLEMECSCYSLAANMLTDPNVKKLLKKTTDLAATMGAPYLHHTMEVHFSHGKLPIYQDAEDTFVAISRETAEYAGEKGISCIYEDQGYLINTPERLGSLLHKVGLPNTGVCLDVGNSLFYDIAPETYAGIFGDVIKNVHIKDYLSKSTFPGYGWHRSVGGNYLYDCPVGHGVVDFEKVISILLLNGYNGYFSLESYGPGSRAAGVPLCLKNLELYYNRAKETIRS